MVKLRIQSGGTERELPLSSLRLTTSLKTAGTLEWETPVREFLPENGSRVELLSEETAVFAGFVFSVEQTGELVRAVCYDQLKYLLCRDTRQFTNRRADQILREIAAERELTLGEVQQASAVIPVWLSENQTLLSMILGAADEEFKSSGRRFCLYDKAGALTFKEPSDADTGLMLSGENLLTGFSRTKSIEETCTRFKLLQEDGRSGFRRVLEAENAEERRKWGVLQYFERVDHSWNEAQLRERLAALQQSMGGEQQRFSVEGTADFRFLAGRGAACAADGGKQSCLIEESQISGEDGVYTMTLRLTAGGNDAAALR